MAEFWEKAFNEKQEMWGREPAKSAQLAKDFFVENSIKDILIPGIGYGRNAQPFIENGIKRRDVIDQRLLRELQLWRKLKH